VAQKPGVQFAFALVWTTSQPARRRFGSPSWSWVGWVNVEGLLFRKKYGNTNCFWTDGGPDAEFWIGCFKGERFQYHS
jgi:hypothetical protein